MGKFRVEVTPKAEKDLEKHFKSGNKANIKKIEMLFIELSEHPYEGTGQPEQLKHELAGYWSRRINQKDRLIYSVVEAVVTVTIVSALGHYSDK
ncbi:addiction module toxin YoeB [Flavobacterium akiainvivens]|uniref:Putative mRNA interferase YoeB n=1 Tax=Flavobacterium akiainvivens TaxID=1202724 RepID=A0A0M8MH80_9FLAO|nr:Txe/YoeB family addiction module toxin [Flavobacterium akiainvivens]KOS06171.1 addiction module toxin YoeB [Flavobacterium akiainvivens]SFQ68222.1 toxin YoeB [Flavobacterium akiainvivens]